MHIPVQSTASVCIVIVAAQRLVIIDRDVDDGLGEGGVLVDGENMVTTADLLLVSSAGLVALGVVDLLLLQGGATVADTPVLQTSIAVIVACEKRSVSIAQGIVLPP
jgi:hypothetical protein